MSLHPHNTRLRLLSSDAKWSTNLVAFQSDEAANRGGGVAVFNTERARQDYILMESYTLPIHDCRSILTLKTIDLERAEEDMFRRMVDLPLLLRTPNPTVESVKQRGASFYAYFPSPPSSVP